MSSDPSTIPDHDWPELLPGWVWLVGAGPGDPGLLTLHGLNALRQADVVVYDALVEEKLLGWAAPGADLIFAGKRGGKPSPKQKDISLTLVELAKAGRRVLRLKGGDPFVFGRGGEEAQTLVQHGVPIRIVPGISAGIGGLAYAGVPVTHRDVNQAVTFLTGHSVTGEVPVATGLEGDRPDLADPPARPFLALPNPFSPSAHIRFQLTEEEGRKVNLRLFDLQGRLVKTFLRSQRVGAGPQDVQWDGRDDWSQSVPNGVYFLKLETPGGEDRVKIVLMR